MYLDYLHNSFQIFVLIGNFGIKPIGNNDVSVFFEGCVKAVHVVLMEWEVVYDVTTKDPIVFRRSRVLSHRIPREVVSKETFVRTSRCT